MARPRADEWLEMEVNEWKNSKVDVVVSLLEHEEVSELGLQCEAELCRSGGIDFILPDSRSWTTRIPTGGFAGRSFIGRRHARRSFHSDPLPGGD